mmetsp:Transcript_18237/g.33286  ORF Transcript_18237/g.33286 Transcript_18237/m.33286 type:complete len:300 (-) Transcript_18237:1206-2105(-)|eukprot:CAMPEP_0175083042 /NCGR_PEP_ID=MMETSP0052_2-20121109/27114_1 /TAXON_ID=51329 ORGANISM="Polytomella parva, Strain SAG 63-3" /NCGR_SAMPLE_ID=MMETSP0052_2 /ASSEMBLY_ACC=CAM_ASM_000194 /LENGTH=299 /DNA_ID=CAMNT_0016354351 /DNA_START=71 /DNA_END=970 /DNA_ORIENTATION=-
MLYKAPSIPASSVPSRHDASEKSSSVKTASHKSPRDLKSNKNDPNTRTITVKNSIDETLVGKFLDTKSEDVVIFCHGFASTKDDCHFRQMAEELAKRNISSIRFDFSGNGESEGSFHFGNYYKEVQDIRSMVLYVRALRRKVFALVGHSKGANDVLLYAAEYDDVPYVVNIAGRLDLKAGVVERFGDKALSLLNRVGEIPQTIEATDGRIINWTLTKRDLDERMKLDMLSEVRRISLAEVLTIHGSQDRVVKVADAQGLARVIPSHSLAIVDGADHNFKSPVHADLLVRKVVDFLSNGI